MTKKWLMYAVTGLLCCGIVGFAVAKQSATNAKAALERAKLELAKPSVSNTPVSGQVNSMAEFKNLARAAATNVSAQAPEGYVAPVQKTVEPVQQEGSYPNKDRIAVALEQHNAGMELSYADKMLLLEYWDAISPGTRGESNGLDATGGPDAFGYRWVDNQGGDTATFAWEESDANWTELVAINGADDQATLISWGSAFPFYGGTYTGAGVSSNGVIHFPNANASLGNTCTWAHFGPEGAAIYPLWDDLHNATGVSSDGGTIRYRDFGDRVIITWDSVGRFGGTATYDFQAQMYIASGKVKLQYRSITGVDPSATIGIQQGNTATSAHIEYLCNTVSDPVQGALDGRAVWFYPGQGNAHDFRAMSVVSPSPLQVQPNDVLNIVGRFTNFGSTTEASPVSYSFNGGAVVTENTAALAQFASEDHDWAGTETAPAVVGDYELVMWSDLATDEDRTNDTIRVMVLVRTCVDEAITAPGTWTGTLLGAGDNCNLRTGTADYIYEVTIPTTGSYTFTLCGGATWDTYLYLNDVCCGGTTIAFNDDSDCGAGFTLQSTLPCVQLTAGTYYLDVEEYSAGGGGAYTLEIRTCVTGACCYNNGSCGVFEEVTCVGLAGIYQGDNTTCEGVVCPNPCALDCDPFDLPEGDESNYCNDNGATDPNGGPNVVPPAFQDIACGDAICGDAFTCDATGYRDTDWFRFTITEIQNVTVTAQSEFNGLWFGIIDVNGAAFIAQNTITDCSLGQQTATAVCLPAGTYAAIALPNIFSGLPQNGSNNQYRLMLDCTPCDQTIGQCCYNNFNSCQDITAASCATLGGFWDEFSTCAENPCVNPCVLTCGNNDVIEVIETDYCLDLTQDPNGGCNAVPPSYTEIVCGDTVCAEAFTCDNGAGRDTDWYRFTVDQAALVTVSATSEFNNLQLYLFADNCASIVIITSANISDCSAGWVSMSAALTPGVYVAFAAYGAFSGLPEVGAYNSYRMAVTGLCVPEPCDPVVDLAIYTQTAANAPTGIQLFWTAPQPEDYKVWSTTNPNNDGNPNDGADVDWTLEATLPGLAAGPQSWTAPAGFVGYKNYNVTSVCNPIVAPTGRCCYGEFQCADNTEADCNGLAGTWTAFLTCAGSPCPPPPPANDDCGSPIEVFNGVPLNGDNTGATGTDISSCGFAADLDIWYVFNATSTSLVTVSTCDPVFDLDTSVSAWDACGGTELGCSEDDNLVNCIDNPYQSYFTFTPAAAGPVLIRVAGWNVDEGTFVLTVTQ